MPPQRTDEPVVLEPGTEVSARFNGAFCEAKIRSFTPDIKLKVRQVPEGEVFVVRTANIITELKDLRVDSEATVRHPTTEAVVQVVVLHAADSSTYMVDFNDGDEKKLKRSALLLKSGKHFDESISLDNLPLTQPEKMAASVSAGNIEDVPNKKRSARNDSIVSGETDDSSDVESVRRSVRQRRPVTYANNGRKDRLPKVDESDSSQSSLKDTVSVDDPVDHNPSTSKEPEKEKTKEKEAEKLIKPEEVFAQEKPTGQTTLEKPSEIPDAVQPPPVKRKVGRPPLDKTKVAAALAAQGAKDKEANKTENKIENKTENISQPPTNTPKVPSINSTKEKDKHKEKEKEIGRTSPKRRTDDGETASEVLSTPSQIRPNEVEKATAPAAAGARETSEVKTERSLQEDYPVKTVVCVLQNGRKKCRWLPGVVVHPESRKKPRVADGNELLVRLFSNSNYVKARRDQVKLFHEGLYNAADEDRVSRFTPDHALQFYRDQTLPPTWKTTMFLPVEAQRDSSEEGNDADAAAAARDDDEEESEANRFMIQFVKWSDERGHPYDNAAMVEDKTVDMYKLYKAVHNAGGYNRCNQENKWEDIREELGFVIPNTSAPVLKEIHQKYLHGHGGFESIYRSLGSSVTDIRLGRKRVHYTSQEARNSVPPPDHSEPPAHSPVPKKRPTSPQQGVKRRRGRPPASARMSIKSDGRLLLKLSSDEPSTSKTVTSTSTPPTVEVPLEAKASGSKANRDISEESSEAVPATDASWTAMRDKAAPDTPPITDPSVLKPGAIVSVLYRKVKKSQVPLAYPARIVDNVGNVAFYVHYEGWNKRYDEWVPLAAITGIVNLNEVGASTLNSSQQARIRSALRRPEWNAHRAQLDKAMNLSPHSDYPIAESSSTTSVTSEHAEAVPEAPISKDVPPSAEDKGTTESGTSDKSQRKRSRSESTLAVPEVPKRSRAPSGTSSQPTVEEAAPEIKKSNLAGSRVAESTVTEKLQLKNMPVESAIDTVKSSEQSKRQVTVSTSEKPSGGSEVQQVSSVSAERVEGEVRKSKSSKRKEKSERDGRVQQPEKSATTEASVAKAGEEDGKNKQTVESSPVEPPREEDRESKKKKKSRSKDAQDPLERSIADIKVASRVASAMRDTSRVASTSTEISTSGITGTEGKQGKSEDERYVSVVALDKPAKVKKARKAKESTQESSTAETVNESAAAKTPSVVSTQRLQVEGLVAYLNEHFHPKPPKTTAAPGKKEKTQEPTTISTEKETGQSNTDVAKTVTVTENEPSTAAEAVEEKPVKEKKARRGPPPEMKAKKEPTPEPVIELALKAPHFASTHSAALERLGLPLDGSESGKETVTEEDDFGNFTRMIVEGVDLTDPDALHTGAATLTGAARIEAYEQCLNDTLLISQLLIHRLATGYHILKRSEELQQDLQGIGGVKREDLASNVTTVDADSVDVKKSSPTASNTSARGRSTKSKV